MSGGEDCRSARQHRIDQIAKALVAEVDNAIRWEITDRLGEGWTIVDLADRLVRTSHIEGNAFVITLDGEILASDSGEDPVVEVSWTEFGPEYTVTAPTIIHHKAQKAHRTPSVTQSMAEPHHEGRLPLARPHVAEKGDGVKA